MLNVYCLQNKRKSLVNKPKIPSTRVNIIFSGTYEETILQYFKLLRFSWSSLNTQKKDYNVYKTD